MRGLGVGQTLHVLIVPEVKELIDEAALLLPSTPQLPEKICAWLSINSMRSERLQFLQLCSQNLEGIWRKKAFRMLTASNTPSHDDTKGVGLASRFWSALDVNSINRGKLR